MHKLKHSRPGHHQPALELQRFEQDQKLCVVNCLSEHIQKTRTVRNDTDQLLLCYTKPFGPARKVNIARWLKSVLLDAGIQNFAPYSFRGATAFSLFNSGSWVDDILKSAGWSKAGTFCKFYKKPIEEKDKKVKEENSICRYFEPKPKMGSNTRVNSVEK